MRRERHRRGVERALRDAMRRDRARTKILRTSPFGLIEMTRQRIRPSLKRSVYGDCPCCSGRGVVKTAESMAIEVASQQPHVSRVTVLNARASQQPKSKVANSRSQPSLRLSTVVVSAVAIMCCGDGLAASSIGPNEGWALAPRAGRLLDSVLPMRSLRARAKFASRSR
jgi:hypothetical protein